MLVRTVLSSLTKLKLQTPVVQCIQRSWLSKLVHARAVTNQQVLETEWEGGSKHQYPYVWLRDNCQCPRCFHPTTRSRLSPMKDLDLNVSPANVKQTTEGVSIEWQDGHVSPYTSDWLEKRRFTADAQAERKRKCYHREYKFWGSADLQDNIPSVEFDQFLSDDHAVLQWLYYLEDYGLVKLTGAPTETNQLLKIGDRVAFLRKTHYGEIFHVKSKPDPNNVAYTGESIDLHADLSFYVYTPGMQMLHCLKQVKTEGGENQYSDSFNVAEQLQQQYPEDYKILTSTLVDIHDIGTDIIKFLKVNQKPVISLSEDGRYRRVLYSNQMRDSYLLLPLDKVAPLYRALKQFDNILNHPDNLITDKLKEGDIVCFHNYRVLHSRIGYKVNHDAERHLEGAYIDWDELYSRRRVLESELLNIEH